MLIWGFILIRAVSKRLTRGWTGDGTAVYGIPHFRLSRVLTLVFCNRQLNFALEHDVDGIHLVQNGTRWRPFVNTVMNMAVSQRAGSFFFNQLMEC